MAFSLRYQVSDTAILSLIEMVNIIIGQEFISPSLYRLWKMFSCSQEDIVKTHFFCEKCHTYISHIDKKITVCSNCGNKVQTSDVQKSSCFLSVSLEAQIKNLINSGTLSIPYIQDFNKSMNVHNQVSDINHGKLYKKLRNENESLFLTYNFSVDGLAVFNSAKGSLWPILVVINEIPPTLRYQNVLLAGIWFGKKEPKMDLYLKPFVEEAVKLGENGISFGPNSKHTIKVFAACCCADSVARPCIQNSTQFNGYYGCTWCKHPGVLVNSVVKYSYKDHLLYEDRREQETIKLMFEAMHKGKSIQGVKGPSVLLPIPSFNIVNGFVPDYMHGIFLGVTKHLVSSWFDTRNKSCNFYLGSPTMCGLINDRMSKFIFPHNVGRIPRGISERALYKASEWKNFLLFICFPCIKDIQKQAYLDHVSLLVGAVEILMQNVITVDDLKTVDCLLLKFVTETQLLYGEDFMTSNMHLLLHYTTSIANWGPLWCHSMFVYEGYNATLQSYIMGTRGVKTQTIRRFLLNQELISNLNKYPVHVSNYISKINLKSKHSQKFIKIGNFNLYGAPHTQVKDICSTNFPTGFFLLNGLTENANIQYFKRMTIENMLFSTKSDKHLRRSDSFIYTQSGFGKIIFIALHLNITKVVVCIQKYEVVTKPNKNIGNMYIVKISDNFIILDPNEIVGKCVEYVDNSGVITISKVPVSHELCT
nr:uncharacterized protein LOC122269708 [Parasteatoda tepidariorum]